MKSFSDKTNIGWNNPLKTVYKMNFYLLFLLIDSLLILGSTRAYCQQSRTISGIVKNSQGETIIGANIVEKGTSNGTITNVDGLFTLRVAPNAILKVSYMGYTEQEVNTRNKNKVEIILTEDARLIDEVVVVGSCYVVHDPSMAATNRCLLSMESPAAIAKSARQTSRV